MGERLCGRALFNCMRPACLTRMWRNKPTSANDNFVDKNVSSEACGNLSL